MNVSVFPPSVRRVNNRLLRGLPACELDALRPILSEIDLTLRATLQEPGGPADQVYFIESGLVSLLTASGRERIEVGIIGPEGFLGYCGLLGASDVLHTAIVQIPGRAWQASMGDLKDRMADCPVLFETLHKFVCVTIAQISQTALANGRCTVEQRLARWLLMADDRLDGHEITLTHEFLSVMLGVRRPGVTVALHVLEGSYAIRSRRSSITVLDRAKLKAIAGSSYGLAEELYGRMFGTTLSAAGV